MTREADVVRSLVEMADTLVDDYDVVDLLTGVADRCVNLLGVSAAGVMLASPAGSLGLVASSSEAMRLLELFELQAARRPLPGRVPHRRARAAREPGCRGRPVAVVLRRRPARPASPRRPPCRCGCGM